jgi:hypothetical protein
MNADLQPSTTRYSSVQLQTALRFTKWLCSAAMIESRPYRTAPLAKTVTARGSWPARNVSSSKSRKDSMSVRCATSNWPAHPAGAAAEFEASTDDTMLNATTIAPMLSKRCRALKRGLSIGTTSFARCDRP